MNKRIRSFDRDQRGILVVGLMVALVTAAAVALAMRMASQSKDMAREATTLANMERIRLALCAYYKLNKDEPLPLPLPVTPPSTTPPSTTCKVLAYEGPSGNYIGNLANLGLPFDAVIDGWGRLISYRFESSSCNIQIDTDGDGSFDKNACVVLISHGRTGVGGCLPNGKRPSLPAGSGNSTGGAGAEWRNAVHFQPYQSVAPGPSCSGNRTDPFAGPCHFDDIVRFYTSFEDLCSF
jgi:hypothetical protein